MFGEVARNRSSKLDIIKVLPLIMLVSLLLPPFSIQGDSEVFLDTVLYTGSIDGEGDEGDIVLAGYRWYECSFTFIDWINEIEDSVISMTYNETITMDLFRYIPSTENLTVLDGSGDVDVRDPEILIQQGSNLTLKFEIWVHMTWLHSSEVKLEPEIWNSTSQVPLDSTNLLRFNIKGELQLVQERIEVLDELGSELTSSEDVKAGSTISVTGIKFSYVDSLERFDDMSPAGDEFIPYVVYDDSMFVSAFSSGVYHSDVPVPDLGDGSVILNINIPGIRPNWVLRVDDWRFSVDIDGIGPKIELLKPIKNDPVAEPLFNWTMKATDRPSPQDVNVNGSRVSYRVWTNTEGWSDWEDTPDTENSQSLTIEMNALGERGSNNTRIQFRAFDVLGNMNISEEFVIRVNLPPLIMDLSALEGTTLQTNESLVVDGSLYVVDPDGDRLDFIWYLDDSEPLSTRKDFRKPLFDVEPGEHVVRFQVKDDFEIMEGSFSIVVVEQPKEVDERNFIEKMMDDENFFWYMLPILVLLVLVPLIILIIAISKKMSSSKEEDFIIDEERQVDQSEAAKRLIETMNRRASTGFDDDYAAEAELESNDFDFEYNLYEVLGLESTAAGAEIKKAYRKLAAYYHPDRVEHHREVTHDDAREEMVKINKAKEILLDPEFRESYDSYLSEMDFSMDFSDIDDEQEEDDEDLSDDWE